jgi:hypothetical protein
MHIFLRRLEKVLGSDKITYHSLWDHVNQGDRHLFVFCKTSTYVGQTVGYGIGIAGLSVGHLLKTSLF